MFQIDTIRTATIAALGVFLVCWGNAQAEQALKAAAVMLEIRVLEAQVSPGQRGRDAVRYRMEVISVLRSTVKVKPGETIVVRADAVSQETPDRGVAVAPARLTPGWLGVAYLNPDPQAARQFTIAADGDSFEDIPPGPPALKWTQPAKGRAE